LVATSGLITLSGCAGDGGDEESPDPVDPEGETNGTNEGEQQQASESDPDPAEFEVQVIEEPETVGLDEVFFLTVSVKNVGEQMGIWKRTLEHQTTFTPSPESRQWEKTLLNEPIDPGGG